MFRSEAAENRDRNQYNACRIDSMELAAQIDEKYLKWNAYNRVDLAAIFAPMMKID